MQTITTVAAMREWADECRAGGLRIGLVPTMGYLHAGHLSLVDEARRRADRVVVSIFVNPLQFGAGEDLERYPRDLPRDTELLGAARTDVLFLPEARELYPAGFQTAVTVENLARGLCGRGRPVHFRGVTTVVSKLFNAVKPHVAVFGCKDFQQLAVVRRMTRDLDFGIEIVGAPIVREGDGLAMSSRNAYLSPAERRAALCLSRALATAQAAVDAGETDAARVVAAVRDVIAAEPLARPEYVELVDSETLEETARVGDASLLALAVHVGKTRLIDNCVLDRTRRAAGARAVQRPAD